MIIEFNAGKRSPYDRIFSNFVPCKIKVNGDIYSTVEHAFQALKSHDSEHRAFVRVASRPGEAKRRGRAARLRDDWEEVKYPIMVALLYLKFQDAVLQNELLATEDAMIVENAAAWDDCVWGIGRGGTGKNLLGKALMEVRDLIKKKQEPDMTVLA